uniref:Isopentenyl-diphosphate Delta-isomerase n=1 Tax=Mesocestoides corti TaxID=53468 RepID=A0A5K3FHN6_MESCO
MGLVRQFARLLFPSTMNATQSEIQIRNSYSRSKHLCQDKYMVTDQCLVVDNYDNVLTTASKKECHYKGGLLHRAFSLFLFRETQPSSGSLELLMQQRSASKITFPLLWTNSCCSHPCLNYAGETNETGAVGVKLAARRKVRFLGQIDPLFDVVSCFRSHMNLGLTLTSAWLLTTYTS